MKPDRSVTPSPEQTSQRSQSDFRVEFECGKAIAKEFISKSVDFLVSQHLLAVPGSRDSQIGFYLLAEQGAVYHGIPKNSLSREGKYEFSVTVEDSEQKRFTLRYGATPETIDYPSLSTDHENHKNPSSGVPANDERAQRTAVNRFISHIKSMPGKIAKERQVPGGPYRSDDEYGKSLQNVIRGCCAVPGMSGAIETLRKDDLVKSLLKDRKISCGPGLYVSL